MTVQSSFCVVYFDQQTDALQALQSNNHLFGILSSLYVTNKEKEEKAQKRKKKYTQKGGYKCLRQLLNAG